MVDPPNPDPPLDREIAPIIAEWQARIASRPTLQSVTPEQMRERAAAEFVPWNSDPLPVADVRNLVVDGPLRAIAVRLYDPAPGIAGGALIHFHGGGWVIGDLELEDGALRRLAAASGVRVLSVDYALAPEHPFPAAIEDGEAVMRWLVDNAGELAVDPTRIALGGKSAGANVALGTALRLRDIGGPMPAFLLLLHGAYSGATDSPSHRRFGDGRYGLTSAAMEYFWRLYAGRAAGHPHAIPLNAALDRLPPAFVHHAELDILADDSIALADRLRAASVPVEHRVYAGATHGFTQYHKASALARAALDDAAAALASALAAR